MVLSKLIENNVVNMLQKFQARITKIEGVINIQTLKCIHSLLNQFLRYRLNIFTVYVK